MKQASKVLYIIGIVVNALGILGYGIFGFLLCAVKAKDFDANQLADIAKAFNVEATASAVQPCLDTMKIVCFVIAAVSIVILLITIGAVKALKNPKKQYAPHIIMIILGVLGVKITYLLGGIFGLVAESKGE